MSKPEFIARQGRKPTGWLGHIVARVMARETRPENERALHMLDLADGDSLIDIGCGHGETLFEAGAMVRLSDSAGVDFSEVMLKRARARNRDAVWDTRLTFHCADTAALPFPDNRFDKALSVHTIYFWPDPTEHLAEIFRVLKPGGSFVLCFRSTEDRRALETYPSTVYRFRSVSEIETTLAGVGFQTIETCSGRFGSRLVHWTCSGKP
ncbi:class I SAM-dependent methyltransferase [Sedimentitalea sp. XS_ASV28]|uniref:class I SAM-dependent methyltransferase n=1 Tax=Sedimentitalea sp. XS_ASV28 TaxID=3241296 RepID=UPI003511736B